MFCRKGNTTACSIAQDVVFFIFKDIDGCLATLKALPERNAPVNVVQLTPCDLLECNKFQEWIDEQETRQATVRPAVLRLYCDCVAT